MPIPTTTIGAYPKPRYAPVPNWFDLREQRLEAPTELYDRIVDPGHVDHTVLLDEATREIVREQGELGIDIPTDGEIRREHYVYYHLRHLDGVDFVNLTKRAMRDGAWTARVPTIAGPIRAGEAFLTRDWQVAQTVTDRPVKLTVPGPLTIIDSTADIHYRNDRALALALAAALNVEIRRLAEAGCTWIQVDEPVFARKPDRALDYGVEALEACFKGVEPAVNKVVHICCGYPAELDQQNYPKADREAYLTLADALETSTVDVVSIEDAHRHNDLALFERFCRTKVILGLVDISRTQIETPEAIVSRLRQVLAHIDAEQVIAGPDCGLTMLPRELAKDKLTALVEAARAV